MRQFGKNLQMLFSRLFRDKQDKKQVHRATIRGVKRDRLRQAEKGPCRVLEALDAAMWNGNTLTQAGRAQLFTGEQAVKNN